jgi:hypothetical protein
MASAKKAPAEPVTRRNRGSVAQRGSTADTRKAVAPRKPAARKATQERGARQEPVPDLLPTDGGHVASPTNRYPHVDPTVIRSAFARAEKVGGGNNVGWDAAHQQWVVPSATDPRRSYRVWRRRGRSGPQPFYFLLECNCVAEQSGSYVVCWHKCAVKMYLDEWFRNRPTQELIEELTDDDPPPVIVGGPDD